MRNHPNNKKIEATKLRRTGLSLSEISYKLNIPKNTIQGWVKNVVLGDSQKLKIKKKIIEGGLKGRIKAREVNKFKIELWKKNIRGKAKKYINSIPKNSRKIGKLICGIFYLCEGAKYPATRHMGFANSDPRMIKLFIKLLRQNFELDNKKFRCRIMHRWDQNGDELNKYWSKETKIPLNQFYRSYFDKRTKGIPTKKENYKGICAIQYLDTNVQFELQAIGEALL